ncbi:phosphotransferase [Umezawaea tangerina]|uniref:Phosphotransferase family enzyme n=1 Tax=Umezawaea tangerina TaxID=84725 RepID=A0A2T0SXK9_9PSEU|nr:phosphotransferase [Umezawaea tangerina]PRY38093.1 phosphotransferase family enzyme [Umezawaea tangerina]
MPPTTRITWPDLPLHIRSTVESILGDTVTTAVSQQGGFSPGTADRVTTSTGLRAFVKAVSTAQNAHSPALHRREILATSTLPSTVPAPHLLGSHDDGDWVVLVLEDIEGRHPKTPWTQEELTLVLTALTEMARTTTPSPTLETTAERLQEDFQGWHRVVEKPTTLDPWTNTHLDDLRALADHGLAALTGDTLVHTDIRADNILLGPDDSVTIVDWPWACRGPAWMDSLLTLVNVRLHGGHDTTRLLDRLDVDRADAIGVLAGLAGFFTDGARLPAPPGLPTLRAFQRAQATSTLSWIRELLDEH